MRLSITPLGRSTIGKMCRILVDDALPRECRRFGGGIIPLYDLLPAERDAIVLAMPRFDWWGPLAEGTESREDNPYLLDITEDSDGDSEAPGRPGSAEGATAPPPKRRRPLVISSDEGEPPRSIVISLEIIPDRQE